MDSLRKTGEDVTEKVRQRNFPLKAKIKGLLRTQILEAEGQLGFWVNLCKGHQAKEKLKATAWSRWSQESFFRKYPFQAKL